MRKMRSRKLKDVVRQNVLSSENEEQKYKGE